MLNEYHGITRRRVAGTVQRISGVPGGAEGLPRWCQSVYLAVKKLDPDDERGTLQGGFRVTDPRKPYEYSLETSGDFTGRVIRTCEQDGSSANIPCDGRIRANKPLLRYLSFLIKSVFSANHRRAMAQGKRAAAPRGESPRYCSAARGKSPATFKRRCIPAELRCSSVEYVQYAPPSRLVSQAPRRSRCYAGFHHGLPAKQ